MYRALTLVLLLWVLAPAAGEAAPAETSLDLHPGGEPLSLPVGSSVKVRLEGDGVQIARAADHLVITPGDHPGTARLLLSTDTRFAAWTLRLDTPRKPFDPELLEAARKACPGGVVSNEKIDAQVQNATCLAALHPLTAALLEREVRLAWNVTGLRAQLALLQKALDPLPEAKALTLGFVGAELMLRGTLPDRAALDRVRLALFDASVGPLRLDLSKLQITDHDPS